MKRPLILAAVVAVLGATSAHAGAREQLLPKVAAQLPDYVQDVDPQSLSTSQLGVIYNIMHSAGSTGEKAAEIRSVLGGRYSLRGLLFGNS
jgi:hypothetical protein